MWNILYEHVCEKLILAYILRRITRLKNYYNRKKTIMIGKKTIIIKIKTEEIEAFEAWVHMSLQKWQLFQLLYGILWYLLCFCTKIIEINLYYRSLSVKQIIKNYFLEFTTISLLHLYKKLFLPESAVGTSILNRVKE